MSMQPRVDLQYASAPSRAFTLDWKDQWEHHLGPYPLHPCTQSHVVSFDLLKIVPSLAGSLVLGGMSSMEQ